MVVFQWRQVQTSSKLASTSTGSMSSILQQKIQHGQSTLIQSTDTVARVMLNTSHTSVGMDPLNKLECNCNTWMLDNSRNDSGTIPDNRLLFNCNTRSGFTTDDGNDEIVVSLFDGVNILLLLLLLVVVTLSNTNAYGIVPVNILYDRSNTFNLDNKLNSVGNVPVSWLCDNNIVFMLDKEPSSDVSSNGPPNVLFCKSKNIKFDNWYSSVESNDKVLWAKFNVFIPVHWPIVVGIGPWKALWSNDKINRFVIIPISDGINPRKWLFDKSIDCSNVQAPIEAGIRPVIWLYGKRNSSSSDNCANSEGRLPTNAVFGPPPTLNVCNVLNNPISGGIVPCKLLYETSKFWTTRIFLVSLLEVLLLVDDVVPHKPVRARVYQLHSSS